MCLRTIAVSVRVSGVGCLPKVLRGATLSIDVDSPEPGLRLGFGAGVGFGVGQGLGLGFGLGLGSQIVGLRFGNLTVWGLILSRSKVATNLGSATMPSPLQLGTVPLPMYMNLSLQQGIFWPVFPSHESQPRSHPLLNPGDRAIRTLRVAPETFHQEAIYIALQGGNLQKQACPLLPV